MPKQSRTTTTPKSGVVTTTDWKERPPRVEKPFVLNLDFRKAARQIPTNSVDLIITDPPYGIRGDTLHKHYNRNEAFVIEGYVEVPQSKYSDFTRDWVSEACRILRPGGSLYVVSGFTNLVDILKALEESELRSVNHIIWKYNFGVNTQRKFVSSHYHVLFYHKPPDSKRTFNLFSRFSNTEKSEGGGSRSYQDREDVWVINREYKPGQVKNKNSLPTQLLAKMIQYSSNPGDTVADLFLGSFSTAIVAKAMNRVAVGCEINKNAFKHGKDALAKTVPGSLLSSLPHGSDQTPENKGKSWSNKEIDSLKVRFRELESKGVERREAIRILAEEFQRGPRFAIPNMLRKLNL